MQLYNLSLYGTILSGQAHDLHVSSNDSLTERQGLSWFLWRYGWILQFKIYSLISKLETGNYTPKPIFSPTVGTKRKKKRE
jgi:hypothetical protein